EPANKGPRNRRRADSGGNLRLAVRAFNQTRMGTAYPARTKRLIPLYTPMPMLTAEPKSAIRVRAGRLTPGNQYEPNRRSSAPRRLVRCGGCATGCSPGAVSVGSICGSLYRHRHVAGDLREDAIGHVRGALPRRTGQQAMGKHGLRQAFDV